MLGTLNEAQARVFVAQRALEEGRGGVSRLSRLTGMSRPTIMKGVAELKAKAPIVDDDSARVRKPGGGRKRVEELDPRIERQLKKILDERTAGDPMKHLKWTNKSTRAMAEELERKGHDVSHVTVARRLGEMGYSLQANVKRLEGDQHPDRDKQFRYINKQVSKFMRSKDPVVSVDTKKKELIGAFENRGKTWRKKKGGGEPVLVHDFPSMAEGKAIPYGTYDVSRDEALVNVGITHETAEFAVESIRRWWRILGKKSYPMAKRLLVCADAGGSNGNRLRGWKLHLQKLSDQLKIPITVCHYPPGGSQLAEDLPHLVAVGFRQHLNDLREANQRSLKFGRVDEVFSLMRRADQNNGAVPVGSLHLGEKCPVRIQVVADCPQDLAGFGVHEVRVLGVENIVGDVSDNPRLRRGDWA